MEGEREGRKKGGRKGGREGGEEECVMCLYIQFHSINLYIWNYQEVIDSA